jgi:Protein of unknown function (DUF3617)
MTKPTTSALIAMVALASASAAWAGTLKVEPGLWKTTVGTVSGPVRSKTHCITQKEIDNFANMLAEVQKARHTPEEDCYRTAFKETTTSVEWKYECKGKFTMTSEGSIKFDKPSHYNGKVRMAGNVTGQAVDNTSIMEGTRLGPCAGNEGDAH